MRLNPVVDNREPELMFIVIASTAGGLLLLAGSSFSSASRTRRRQTKQRYAPWIRPPLSRSKSSFVIGNSKPKSDGEEAKEGHREKRRLYFGSKSNIINRLNFEK